MFRKWQTLRRKSKGFTLIELMIVVAIIAILAAIAIPQYKKFQLKSKTTEAKANIGSIKTAEEAFMAEHDVYIGTNVYPTAGVNAAGAKQTWDCPANTDFDVIGFQPAGDVYYAYQVTTTNDGTVPTGYTAADAGTDMCISAAADLDADGTNGEFGYATDNDNDGTIDVATTSLISNSVTQAYTIQDLTPGEF